jgi:hypothetical protein
MAVPRLRRIGATPAAQCGPRRNLDLPAHAVAAGRLQLPSSADLFGLWRRSDRAFRPVGRRMDDAGAAIALPALGYLGNRQRAADTTGGRAMVYAVAVRTLARGQRAVKQKPERDAFWLHRHRALSFCLSKILFGKPVSTFPDHALSREPEKASRLLERPPRSRSRVPRFVPHRFGNRGGRGGLDIHGLAGGQPDR